MVIISVREYFYQDLLNPKNILQLSAQNRHGPYLFCAESCSIFFGIQKVLMHAVYVEITSCINKVKINLCDFSNFLTD